MPDAVAEASQEDAEAAARSSAIAGEAGVDGSTTAGEARGSNTAGEARGSTTAAEARGSTTAGEARCTGRFGWPAAASGFQLVRLANDAEREVFAPATTVDSGYGADEVVWSRMGPHPVDQGNGGRFFT